MAEAKRKLAAILAADVAGYSKLMGDDEHATVAALNASREVFKARVSEHDGRVVDTAGDSVLATFDSVVEAVQCASEVQTALGARNRDLPDHRRMAFRIGVNLGDVIEQDDGTIYGDGVNVAARLESLAQPGGICLSGSAHEQVEGKTDYGFEDIGEHEVKNIARPVRAYRVADDGAAMQAEEKIKDGQAHISSEGPALAVLPFANLSSDADQAYFADGIVEEIITELSRFGDLRVLGRVSTLQYKDRAADVREIGRELDVDYLLEGSVRRGGERLRVTAQLLDAKGGGHLWAETYQRDLTATDIFDIQDDITAHVVSQIGGAYGVIARKRMGRLAQGRTRDLAAYDSMRLYHQWLATFDDDDYRVARKALETAVDIDPSYADAWAGLSSLYASEVTLFFDFSLDSLDRALTAAEHAVRLAPDHAIGYRTLAHARLQRREDKAFFEIADKALLINSNDTAHMAAMGVYLCFAGEWDRGEGLLKSALERWPGAGRPKFLIYLDHYRKGDFDGALAVAREGAGIGQAANCLFAMAAYGAAGRLAEAHQAQSELLRLRPNIEEYLRACRHRVFDHIVNGLSNAGFDIPDLARDPA